MDCNKYSRNPGLDVINYFEQILFSFLTGNADKEDLALTLNGKKKKITRNDFIIAFRTLNIDPKHQENIFRKIMKVKAGRIDFTGISFLSDDFKERLMNMIGQRFKRII